MDKYFPFPVPRWAVLASLSHGLSKCPMGFFLAHIGVQLNNSSQCRLHFFRVNPPSFSPAPWDHFPKKPACTQAFGSGSAF